MEETEHALTKMIVQTVIVTAAASVITKTITAIVPRTQKYKIAEMSGSVIAAKLVTTFEHNINDLVDMFYERRKARKLKLF